MCLSDGELRVEAPLATYRLRWQPEAKAEELLVAPGRWVACWPDFRLLKPEPPTDGDAIFQRTNPVALRHFRHSGRKSRRILRRRSRSSLVINGQILALIEPVLLDEIEAGAPQEDGLSVGDLLLDIVRILEEIATRGYGTWGREELEASHNRHVQLRSTTNAVDAWLREYNPSV